MTQDPSFQRALAAAYIMCCLLVEAGYFIGLGKSQCTPSTCVRFLGFVCDSVRQAFVIPQDQRNKFAMLKEDILLSTFVSLKTLQRFSGKVISFCLAIPGSKLYVREVFYATVNLEANLQAEIGYWRLLDDWRIVSDGELIITCPLRLIPMVQRRLGAELCAWGVTLWSPGITGWTIQRILTFSWPKLC